MKIDKHKVDLAMANKCYSAEELAEITGISPITIARIRRGIQKPRPKTIGMIARALNVPVENLIQKEGD